MNDEYDEYPEDEEIRDEDVRSIPPVPPVPPVPPMPPVRPGTATEVDGVLRAVKSLARSVESQLFTGDDYKGTGSMIVKSYKRLHSKVIELLPDDFYINDVLALEVDEEADERAQIAQVQLALNQLSHYLQSVQKDLLKHGKTDDFQDLREMGRSVSEHVISLTRQAVGRAISSIDIEIGEGQDFSGQSMPEADFSNEHLDGANFSGCDLTGANFENARLRGANLSGAVLVEANLENASLRFANVSGADFTGAKLENAQLRQSNLSGTVFVEANLENAGMRGANATGADFTGAKLENAQLRDANLTAAVFVEANLENANMRGANTESADFTDAKLENATMPNRMDYRKGIDPARVRPHTARKKKRKMRGDVDFDLGKRKVKIAFGDDDTADEVERVVDDALNKADEALKKAEDKLEDELDRHDDE